MNACLKKCAYKKNFICFPVRAVYSTSHAGRRNPTLSLLNFKGIEMTPEQNAVEFPDYPIYETIFSGISTSNTFFFRYCIRHNVVEIEKWNRCFESTNFVRNISCVPCM